MQTKPLIVTELHTNTIYMSETCARDIRKPKTTPASQLFKHFKKLFPEAKVVYLTDKEFDDKFQEIGRQALNDYKARFVLTNELSKQTLMHSEKIA